MAFGPAPPVPKLLESKPLMARPRSGRWTTSHNRSLQRRATSTNSGLAGLEVALDDVEVVSLLDRGFRGLAKTRQHWHTPVGDRRTKDRLTLEQRAFNRVQASRR